MRLLKRKNLPEMGISSRRAHYIDSVGYRKARAERLNKLHFFHLYYTGEIYHQKASWTFGNRYSPSVEPPSINLNYARFIIDRLASFAFDGIMGVRLGEEVIPLRGAGASANRTSKELAFLKGFLMSSGFLADLVSVAREALISGDVALKLWNSPEGDFPLGYTLIPADAFDYEHQMDDVRSVEFFREEYGFIEADDVIRSRRVDTYPDEIITYRDHLSTPSVSSSISWLFGNYRSPLLPPVPERVESRIPNPMGLLPFVHVANKRRTGEKFGVSELADITPILDDINWKFSQRSRNISRTMNAIIKNVNGRLVHDRFDDTQIISVLGEGAQLEYLVNPSNLEPVETHVNSLKQALTDLTGVVMLSPEKLTSIGPLSGFALSILYEPLINSARRIRSDIGSSVERFLALVLRAGKSLGILKDGDSESVPRLIYAPDLQFTEEEKLTRLRRFKLAKEANLTKEETSMTVGE